MSGSDPLQDRFDAEMAGLLPGATATDPDGPSVCVAVSGGSDSTALMYLAARWARALGRRVHIATVDHRLRAGAREEAEAVARAAGALGLSHDILTWDSWDGQGNLQAEARGARRTLLARWARSISARVVLLGHTMDDQAETFAMNLARGSGVAGLSGMAPAMRGPEGVEILRPLLGERRAHLRDWLAAQGIAWAEDPSNEDPRFDRVRVRAALAEGALGLSVEGLAETARRMARARGALEARAREAAERLARVEHGDVVFDGPGLAALDEETRLTLVAQALRWVASAPYRPRAAALEAAIGSVLEGRQVTLHGCILSRGAGKQGAEIRVCREYVAVARLETEITGRALWDRRWVIAGAEVDGLRARALGAAGLSQMRDLPALDRAPEPPPRASLTAAPSVWDGDTLVAVPPFRGVPCLCTLAPALGPTLAASLGPGGSAASQSPFAD